ncbi:MAG: hypothetical protein ACOC8N_03395 [Spirochaetota bacterium]
MSIRKISCLLVVAGAVFLGAAVPGTGTRGAWAPPEQPPGAYAPEVPEPERSADGRDTDGEASHDAAGKELVRLEERVGVAVESYSGTPLVLEFLLEDPDRAVTRVDFDFNGDGAADLTVGRPEGGVLFRGVPYRQPGVYRPRLLLHTRSGTIRRDLEVAFAGYRWGRDNFRFANDGEYEDAIDFVSTTVIDWAVDRFGPIDQEQQMLLLYFMYRMYRGSIGRCYGFTGGQLRYLVNGDSLPPLYSSVYSLLENDTQVTRRMDWVQNDIVFSNFLTGRIDVEGGQDEASLRRELRTVKASIGRGEPIIIGYISSSMHHSMVVYGYFENPAVRTVTLVTANNWEREQESNTYSEDAENLVIDFSGAKPELRWFDVSKGKHRSPLKIFAVPLEERYSLSRDQLLELLARMRREVLEAGRTVIMVEMTGVAYVEDGEGRSRGYVKPKYVNRLPEVEFKKIDYNYVFQVPPGGEYLLKLKDRRFNRKQDRHNQVNLFALFPHRGDSHRGEIETVALRDVRVFDDREVTYRIGNGSLERLD